MSIKEVTALRKQGRLEDAYTKALAELNEDDNEWTEMSLFWVLRDMCKQELAHNNFPKAQEMLSQMEQLLPTMLDDNGAGKKAFDFLRKQALPNAGAISNLSDLSKSNPTEAYNKAINQFGKGAERLSEQLHEEFSWIIYRYLKENRSNLTSIQVRTLLRDYMQLKNPRPSVVHSMILNFALNFAKDNRDFRFANFLKLWGIQNLRTEDFHNSTADDHEIPSLLSRIIRVFVESGQPVDWVELITSLEENPCCLSDCELMDLIRQQHFWQLMNLQKEKKWELLWNAFASYANTFSAFGSSKWHSEILKIAHRFMVEGNAWRMLPFAKTWNVENLRSEDWRNEIGKDGNEYKSLAQKVAKKCFEVVENRRPGTSIEDIQWLQNFYKQVVAHDDDKWNLRNLAIIHLWLNEKEEATSLYKQLLAELSDKFYLWAELASCIENDNDLRIGLLLKAKSLEKNEDYIGDIHLDLADLWILKKCKSEALKELQLYTDNRIKKNWKIAERAKTLAARAEALDPETEPCNIHDYIAKAEDYMFDKYDWTYCVLLEKWKRENTEYCSFSNGDDLYFSIKSKRFHFLRKSRRGDVVKFKLKINDNSQVTVNQNSHKTVTPFIAYSTDLQPWSIIPITYGYVEYDNKECQTLRVVTQDSDMASYRYKKTTLKKGDFVSLRVCKEKKGEKTFVRIGEISRCAKEEALPHFSRKIAVVDDVNKKKELFHIVLGFDEPGAVIRFNETNFRPNIGDFVELIYCICKNKEGIKYVVPISIKTTDETNDMRKDISGYLDVHENHNGRFGFIDNCYVPASVLEECWMYEEEYVTAKAVYVSEGRWKVYHVDID